FVFVQPQFLRERRRQVHHLVLAADGKANHRAAGLIVRAASARRKGRKGSEDRKDGKGRKDRPWPITRSPIRHTFHLRSHRSSRVTPALAMTTTIASTVIPAKTPVVSKVPSAWETT